METQFRKSTFKECSYSDQCLLFGDNPSLIFNMNSERARRSGKEEYTSLLGNFPSICSQTIVESLIGREAIIFFFKQANVSVELTKELVRSFFKENLQNQCGNHTENALESLRIFVPEMPKGMYNFLSVLEFQERNEKHVTISIQFLLGFSIILSFFISSFVVLGKRFQKSTPVSNAKPQSHRIVQLVKNVFLKLDDHNKNIYQAETLIKNRLEKSEKLKIAIENQEKRISELSKDFTRMLIDSKAKDSTINKTLEILNEIKDVIQCEKGREPLDVLNMHLCLKELFKEKSKLESIIKEKNIKILSEKRELELQNKELNFRVESILSENDDLGFKVSLLEESLKNQKSITISLEDSVLNQSDQISKLLHSLKMKEDQELKTGTEMENIRNDLKLLEKQLNQIYNFFGIVEDRTFDSVRTAVDTLRKDSELKSNEIEKLQEQLEKNEETTDEKVVKLLEIESRFTALQDENNNLRSQLNIAIKKIESKYEKAAEHQEALFKDLEIARRDLLKTKSELETKQDFCKTIESEIKLEKEKQLRGESIIFELNKQSENYKKTIQTITEENESLAKKFSESLKEAESKVEFLENKQSHLEKDITQAQTELSKRTSDYSALKQNCDEINTEKSILENKLKETSQKYEKVCANILERKTVFEEAKTVIGEKTSRIEELSVIVKTLNESLEKNNTEILLKESKIEELSGILDQLRVFILDSPQSNDSSIVSTFKETMEKQRENISNLELEVEGLRGTLNSKSQIFVDYQHKIDEISELLEFRTKKIDELDIELQFIKKEKTNLENEIVDLKKLIEEKEVKIKELTICCKKLTLEKLTGEASLNEEIDNLSNENTLMKEKIDKMNEALSKKVNKIDDAYNYIEVLNSESENLSSLHKAMEDKYLKALFEKKQFNDQKDKYERIIESLKSQNEKLLDELNNQQ